MRRWARAGEGGAEQRPAGVDPSLWWTLRSSMSALFDDFGRFFVANTFWFITCAAALGLAVLHVAAHALLVLLLPVTAGLGRMAAITARDRPARLRHFRDGLTARWPFAPVLGIIQFVLVLVGWINFQIGMAAASLPLVAAAVAAGWLLLFVAASAVAIWPLLLDPERDGVPPRQILRLAAGVVAARPGRIILAVTLEVVIGIVCVQAMVAALILPSVGVLFAVHAVLPVADRLTGAAARDR